MKRRSFLHRLLRSYLAYRELAYRELGYSRLGAAQKAWIISTI